MPRRKDCIINDSITDALFILLGKKNANDISVTEWGLCFFARREA